MKNIILSIAMLITIASFGQSEKSKLDSNYYQRAVLMYGLPKAKWVNIEKELPKEVGDYLVYRQENDTVSVLYWDGRKFGYNGYIDLLVTDWAMMPQSPIGQE